MTDNCCEAHGLVRPCSDCEEQGVIEVELYEALQAELAEMKAIEMRAEQAEAELEKMQHGMALVANSALGAANREIIEPLLIADNHYLRGLNARLREGEVEWTRAARAVARTRDDFFKDEPVAHQNEMGCGKFILHLVDIVWGDAMEDGQVPSTRHAIKLIARAEETLDDNDD